MSVALLGSTAIVVTVATTDYAYAKNGNGNGGNGNGNGGNNGNGNGGDSKGNGGDRGKSASKGKSVEKAFARGNSGTKPGKSGQSGKSGKEIFNSLKANLKSGLGFLNGSRPTKQASAKTTSRAPAVASRPVKGPLHPSNLGNLNGALNSSPNAKLAHIRNGNFSGPVGLAAALAVADYQYATDLTEFTDAQAVLDLAQAYAVIENAPSETDIADAQAVVDLAAAFEAQALLDNAIDDGQADLDAQDVLDAYGSLDGLTAPSEPDLTAAREVLDYPDVSEAEALTAGTTEPGEAEVAAAQATVDAGEPTLDDVTTAEAELLEAWNKGDADSPDSGTVLDAIRGSLPSPDAISSALPEEEPVGDLAGEPAPVVEVSDPVVTTEES
ncbi:MAG: hypothetical protein JXR14_06095 [Paracoccaceae bacterium]